MASPKPQGSEICVKEYEYVTVYFALKILKGSEAKQKEDEDKQLDELCRALANDKYKSWDPEIGQVVGVFLPSNNLKGQWVRGRVEQHLKRVNGSEYKVLLIDRGEYVMTKRQYMVQLTGKFCTNPPAAKKLGLYGVLPVCDLDENIKIVLTDFFDKGPAYFKKYGKLKDILFGDISVEQMSDGQIVNLASHLLENGLVKKIENFETEARKHYFLGPVVTEIEEEGACAMNCYNEEQKESAQSSMTVHKDKRDESRSKAKDTGYSSEDDSDSPFYRPDAILIPAGFNYATPRKNKTSQNNVDKRPLKNYYQIIREQPKSRIKNEKSPSKSYINSKAKSDDNLENQSKETKIMKREVNWNQKTSDQRNEGINHDYQHTCFIPKKVNFFEMKSQELKDLSNVSNNRIHTFDLNYKVKVDCRQKDVNKNEVKEFCQSNNIEVSKEIINSKENRSKDLGTTQGFIDSSDDSYVKKGLINNVGSNDSKLSSLSFNYQDNSKSSLISKDLISPVSSYDGSYMNKKDDSVKNASTSNMVSADSVSYTDSSNSLSLSKKQRLIRKLTCGKEVQKMMDSLTTDAPTSHITPDVEDKSVKIIDSLTTDAPNSHIGPDVEDKSVKISSNDCAESTYCADSNSSKNNSIAEKRRRSKEKWKRKSITSDAQTSLVCADYSDLEVKSVKMIEGLTTDTQTNHISPDLEDKCVKISSNDCPESTYCADSNSSKSNSIFEKRRRSQEKWKRKKEAEMLTDSETSGRDLTTSCSQSVCSETPIYSSNPGKLTLESILGDSVVESESMEENFEYVDTSEVKTFVKGIQTTFGVLIHTKDNKIIQPAISLKDLHLNGGIIETLKRQGMREMNRIQMLAFPMILARRNIALISPPRAGKTFGYVVPISSNLLIEEYYKKLPKGNGPRALVVTPCWESGAFVASCFRKMSEKNIVVHSYGGGAEGELQEKLLKGCDVLVTTLRCLLRLLDNGLTNLTRLCHFVMDDADILFDKFKPDERLLKGCDVLVTTLRCLLRLLDNGLTNLTRLSHFVMDDADILFDKFKPEMQQLMVSINSLEEMRDLHKVKMQLQVVLVARKWTTPVKELVTHILANPSICISSQLEACVYAGIKPTAIFVQADKKIEKLVSILKDFEGKQKTVVMCRSKDDVKYVYKVLIDMGVKNVIAAHEDLSSVGISEVPGFWHQSKSFSEEIWNQSNCFPIMVRSDGVLEDVPVTNANVLIHYNMSNSKKTFSLRFICLVENYNNILKEESKPKPQTMILLDEKNDLELPGVMEFMVRLGTVLPESVRHTLEEIEKMKDENRMSQPLCEHVKEFGECWDEKQCKARHLVTKELDTPDDVPRKGWVKLIVQHVHNASHFSVRLLEHAEEKDQWQRLPSSLLTLPIRLNNHFASQRNKRMHGPPAVGDVAAVETATGVYQRAVVLRITAYNRFNEAVRVDIRLMDNGRYDNIPVICLWSLPHDMAVLPPSTVDVYLCSLMPKDLDVSWPPEPGIWVEEQLRQTRRDSPDGCLVGKIKFALKGSLWLDPVEYQQFLPSVETTIYLLNLRRNLLQTNNATENPSHLPMLRRLCEKAGMELPPEKQPVVTRPKQPHPRWAWLPSDEMENVHIIVVQDPEVIFLRLNKFCNCLDKLMKEIQTYASNVDLSSNCDNVFEVGDVCLGKLSGNDEWNRAMIKSKPTEDKAELFYVDFGDIEVVPWSRVLPIPNEFISKLPFQVIECYLAGVKFLKPDFDSEEWVDEVVDMIYNLSRDEEEQALSLSVKVCSAETKAMYTSGRRYKVVLANCDVEPNVIINSKLVSSVYAEMSMDNELLQMKESESSECEEVVPSTSSLDKVPAMHNLDVALPEESTMTENEKMFSKLLKDLEEGSCDCSLFHRIEDDADISDNTSEGSALSLPCPGGSLPSSSPAHLALPSAETEDSRTCTSKSISSSHNSLTLSLHKEKNQSDDLQNKQISSHKDLISSSQPMLSTSQEFGDETVYASTPITTLQSSTLTSTSTSENWNVKELISSNFLGQSVGSTSFKFVQNISSKLKYVSQITYKNDDLDDEDFDSTMYELKENMNQNSSQLTELKIGFNTKSSPSHETVQNSKETAYDVKLPRTLEWVKCLPESDNSQDADSIITKDSMTNVQVDDNTKVEVKTPMVEWHQDDNFVFLRIKLPALKKYEVSFDVDSVKFSAEYEGVLYKVDLSLFGAHHKDRTQNYAGAFFFEIKLEKTLKGQRNRWPRLTRHDQKLPWLKINVEKFCEELTESDDEDVKRIALSLPCWNDNPNTETNSVASSEMSEVANSELSM